VWLEGKAWDEPWDNLQRRAWRLEVQQAYTMPGEREMFERFRRGETPPADHRYPWRDEVERNVKAGMYMGRVHVVQRPVSDYLRFQATWAYELTVPVGEDVRILDLSTAPNPGLPDEDFWILDDSVVRMLFRPDGTQIGRKLVEDSAELPRYEKYMELAIANSMPFSEWWSSLDDH
jgi:hypothetical protein